MSNENDFPNSSAFSDAIARSPETVTTETTDTISDQDVADLIVRDSNTVIQINSTDNDGRSIEVGDAQPVDLSNQPVVVADDQPTEIDGRHQQAFDTIPDLPSPINEYIVNDHETQLSPTLQIVPIHVNNPDPDSDVILIERETHAEHIQHEYDDLHIELIERTATEPVESPVRYEAINNQIRNFAEEPTDIIDLTQDDDNDGDEGSHHLTEHEIEPNGVVSPVTIDLTGDDNEVEDIHEVIDITGDSDQQEGPREMALNVDHNEQTHPITERLAPVAVSSSEAADHGLIYSPVTDTVHHTIESIAQLQPPTLLSRNKKRFRSSDETKSTYGDKHFFNAVKRRRKQTL